MKFLMMILPDFLAVLGAVSIVSAVWRVSPVLGGVLCGISLLICAALVSAAGDKR